jgi:O-acetyl-ADP-ribose deacetylase (regulator of RNase III)
MITYKTGNILQADVDALVNTVNCVGVMGRGIAAQFKKSYPDNFAAYARACNQGDVQPGRMFIFEPAQLSGPRFVINFPTKRHWKGKSRMEDIRSGLEALAKDIQELGIRSIAVPPLGSGLGGLDWRDVRPLIQDALAPLADVEVLIYEPSDVRPDARPNSSTAVPKMTPGRAALIGLMRRYLAGLMDPDVSLLEVHKLMYFLQEAGEPLKLKFNKAHYGPYAENLRHVLRAIEGHYVSGYMNDGDKPDSALQLVPGARELADETLKNQPGTIDNCERVARLIDGFESPIGMELLATVHWVSINEVKPLDKGGVVHAVHAWSTRKRTFSEAQIAAAFDRLVQEHWLVSPTTGA